MKGQNDSVQRKGLVLIDAVEQPVGDAGIGLDLKSQLGIQLQHFAGQLVLREVAFFDQHLRQGMKHQCIVIVYFLHVGKFCVKVNFFQIYQPFLQAGYRLRAKLLIYHIRALGDLFRELLIFHNLSIFLTRFCQKSGVYFGYQREARRLTAPQEV